MRYFKIFSILVLTFILVGCTIPVPEPDDEVIPPTDLEILEAAANTVIMPNVISTNYEFIRQVMYQGEEISVSWKSNKTTSLSNFGIVRQGYQDEEVILTATFYYKEQECKKIYYIVVPAMSNEMRFEQTLREISLSNDVSSNINLPTEFLDEDMKVSWKSSHPDILSETGEYHSPSSNTVVILTIVLELGSDIMEKEYQINVLTESQIVKVNHHLVLDYVEEYDENFFDNCHLENDKLVLDENAIEGTYLSKVFEVSHLTSLVASWGAITSTNATCEVEVRVKVNDKWSMYFSYGAWGLGLENKPMINGNDDVAKMDTDEIIVKNYKEASAIQYKVTLRRNSSSNDSPILSFVALALDYNKYEYPIDATTLPSRVDYDVPQLNQNVVPVIGNSICSPTSSTMLLKYKGHSFSGYDEYENRYIANLSKDYGNNIFGNWTYCTVIMASFGETAYVMRMYSLDELKEHLANVGPVALSVKGQMDPYSGEEKGYYTAGHLLVCRGYYEENGKTIFICNDPNMKSVYVEYSEQVIKSVWRMVAYVIE